MTTTATGLKAETAAIVYLERHGFTVHDRNWKTKVCEIDIVAQKDSCLHFIEVKYRAHDSQGRGLEYITKAKIRRMRFAAEIYASQKGWKHDINLAGIEVSGPSDEVTAFIESIAYDA